MKTYGSNLTLALQRALAVRDWLGHNRQNAAVTSAVLVVSGATNVGANLPGSRRMEDRRVDILASWEVATPVDPPGTQEHPRAPWKLNIPTGFDVGGAFAFLAFVVALSAYLASVRLFLKQKQMGSDGRLQISASNKMALVLITIADLPMILSGLFFSLYLFSLLRWPPLVSWSLLLFIFAGGTMVILHGREWFESAGEVIGKDNVEEAWRMTKEAATKGRERIGKLFKRQDH
jgi:hypothetical protein